MFVLSVIVMSVLGLWLVGSLIGLVFKFTFAIVGGVLGAVGALLGVVLGAFALLLAAPFVLLALLPVFLPVLLLAALVWLAFRAARPAPRTVGPAH